MDQTIIFTGKCDTLRRAIRVLTQKGYKPYKWDKCFDSETVKFFTKKNYNNQKRMSLTVWSDGIIQIIWPVYVVSQKTVHVEITDFNLKKQIKKIPNFPLIKTK